MTPTGLTRAELKEKGRKLLKKDGKQILLVFSEGRVYAIANRCPHEGYPLSEGTLDSECRLTCNWHNWKFDLASGANLTGGDALPLFFRSDLHGFASCEICMILPLSINSMSKGISVWHIQNRTLRGG